jgi:hypothetical protein
VRSFIGTRTSGKGDGGVDAAATGRVLAFTVRFLTVKLIYSDLNFKFNMCAACGPG